MVEKFKTIILAFSGLIVYSALCTALGYIFTESVYIRLISDILTIILGCLYINTVIKYPKVWDKPPKKLLFLAMITMVVFVFTSLFTTDFLLLDCINDEAFAASIEARAAMPPDLLTLSVIVSVFLAPVTEEIMFRGLLYRQLSVFSKSAALIISSLIFAVWHGTLIHLYTAFLGGIILGCIYEKTQRLSCSIFAHMLFNALTILVDTFSYSRFFSTICFVVPINIVCIVLMVLLYRTEGIKQEKRVRH